ncbi:GerMN domain-containing protein [Salipaludibacillus sp. CUR1]|uniref:GerMN domain-containing protein n=1 Tax=Salipaludibacillus sp. CUR1 TaxID=2820003 RepID=UPI001E28FEF2|nr:GerMN domain-containing protein [Salipaludibacillus sp. CUR1]MCE7794114.1 GerMN domain-containing protein [Salipaludibacillus sp. CUR1]
MKHLKMIVLSLSLLLVLAACGQNENVIEEEDGNNTGNAGLESNETEVEETDENDPAEANNEENENNLAGNNDNADNNNENNVTSNEANEETAEEEVGNAGNTNEDINEEANEEGTAEDEDGVVDPVTLYFSDDQLLNNYREKTDLSVSADEPGAMEAMDLWTAGPSHDDLYTLLPEGTAVEHINFQGDTAHISFSEEITEANLGSSGELMLIEQIAMMMEQFGYDQTKILISGEEVDDFLGHADLTEPVSAGNPEDFEWIE